MSLRLEMLQVARLSPPVLGTEATALVETFVRSKQNEDGGFQNRAGLSDLYYTSFAIDSLTALQRPLPDGLTGYLAAQEPASLDFVHASCLARLLSATNESSRPPARAEATLARLESFRTPEGGYNQKPDAATGSAYGCFLACGAYADHHQLPPRPDRIAACLNSLSTPSGGWANDAALPIPNVPATAAAVALSRTLRLPIPERTGPWLLACFHAAGGCLPFPGAPMPDLLSTAVALHALDGLQFSFASAKDSCLDFIDSLWTADGGFHANWTDHDLDLEYTYYGLLALGHLAL